MKRFAAIAFVLVSVFLTVVLYTPLKDFLWVHPWLQSFLGALPALGLVYFAYVESVHSNEANALRSQTNTLHSRIAALEEERNQHLQQIAENTRRPTSQAEINAAILRRHLGAKVKVTEGQGSWGDGAEIVEITDDNIATLFTPCGFLSSCAFSVQVRCDEMEVTQVPEGACPIRIKVLKRYGEAVQWGEIKKWEDRLQSPVTFLKGENVCHALYVKPGVAERRSLNVYQSKDKSNSFILESSKWKPVAGDNIAISKTFMSMQIDYEADGFRLTSGGSGAGGFPLYIKLHT